MSDSATGSRSGRLVAAWQRPVLLAMVVCLCFWAYYAFWSSVLPYRHETVLHPAGLSHVALCTWLWVMSVWNYAACTSVENVRRLGSAFDMRRVVEWREGKASWWALSHAMM